MSTWHFFNGSLFGANSSKRVSEESNGFVHSRWLWVEEFIGNTSLTVRLMNQAETKVGQSDPVFFEWNNYRKTEKKYPRDNRLIFLESSYRRKILVHRCRLFLTWCWSWYQGFDCSSSNKEHELGSERRESVWFLSAVNERHEKQ